MRNICHPTTAGCSVHKVTVSKHCLHPALSCLGAVGMYQIFKQQVANILQSSNPAYVPGCTHRLSLPINFRDSRGAALCGVSVCMYLWTNWQMRALSPSILLRPRIDRPAYTHVVACHLTYPFLPAETATLTMYNPTPKCICTLSFARIQRADGVGEERCGTVRKTVGRTLPNHVKFYTRLKLS